ncbi:hypothetical protein [Methanosarcina sp. WWM596]|uniref:hypothetical protein n=1 Tax=Methanosarcina sp. WWM596 TaxID=1434103 RepID=UPI000B036BF4|nr:hypothetical protein [Methanosarcina sp. WWM596]
MFSYVKCSKMFSYVKCSKMFSYVKCSKMFSYVKCSKMSRILIVCLVWDEKMRNENEINSRELKTHLLKLENIRFLY